MDNTRMETAMDTSISSAHHTRFQLKLDNFWSPVRLFPEGTQIVYCIRYAAYYAAYDMDHKVWAKIAEKMKISFSGE